MPPRTLVSHKGVDNPIWLRNGYIGWELANQVHALGETMMKSTVHSRAQVTRRNVLGTIASVGGVFAAPAVLRAQSRQLVFASWGGSWEAAMRSAWFDPFTTATGIDVQSVSGNSYGRVQAMVEAGRPEWDVVEVLPEFQWIGAEKNLLEPLDFSIIDTSGVMDGEDLVTDVSIPQVLFSNVLTYNTRFPEVPDNFGALWDTERFPGRRAFESSANSGMLEAALLADGVDRDALYPLDVDRALAKLDEIRDDILFYETNAQGEQFMSDGQASIGILPDGRALNIRRAGAPVDIQYAASFLTWSTMVVPRGAPNAAEAMEFLAYTLTPEAQAAIAKAYTYGPVVPAAFDMIDPERAAILSGGPQMQDKAVLLGEKWWSENLQEVSEKLTEWMLG